MQKAEYRYYEISQDLPVMALSGKKWEIIYGTDNMHFHNCLEIDIAIMEMEPYVSQKKNCHIMPVR